jgi:hypothetical protein
MYVYTDVCMYMSILRTRARTHTHTHTHTSAPPNASSQQWWPLSQGQVPLFFLALFFSFFFFVLGLAPSARSMSVGAVAV